MNYDIKKIKNCEILFYSSFSALVSIYYANKYNHIL